MTDILVSVEFTCPICGKTHFLDNLPQSKVDRALNRKYTNEHIQDIFPDMNTRDREKFISGFCDDCQKDMFGE